MRIRIVSVGRTRNKYLRALADDYLERVRRFTACEINEVRESAKGSPGLILDEEAMRIRATVEVSAIVVALDVEGTLWSSHELARRIEDWQNKAVKESAFIIGGHGGTAASVLERADFRWSLGRITLPHEMARVVVLEQIYRAHTILRGLPYQK
ncbi:MAG: 23S rRNA (pseudouridine(1915)-N(3))-methyltransferase RlmH [Pyrinomonadaceae bacterium MAG19_C2-C3]|nr:23S rRNA (pseudouridine(1915)-N(3))-methyltransferase RlmH [Pyrinomonadaceae bacterium MAG19_C2-C3]